MAELCPSELTCLTNTFASSLVAAVVEITQTGVFLRLSFRRKKWQHLCLGNNNCKTSRVFVWFCCLFSQEAQSYKDKRVNPDLNSSLFYELHKTVSV